MSRYSMQCKTADQRIAARHIPTAAVKVSSKHSDAVVYLYNGVSVARPSAIGYVGTSHKPAFQFYFKSEERRTAFVADWLKKQDEAAASKVARKETKKAEAKKGHQLAVGDVLRCSWGYDQTNIDFYEVTALIGARMVEIKEVTQMTEQTGHMSGACVPVKGSYTGKTLRKLVQMPSGDSVRIASYASAYKVTPTKVAGVDVFAVSHFSNSH